MRITLVNPGQGVMTEQPPLGLMSLASYLELHSHEVKIVDCPLGESLEDNLVSFRPDAVGITTLTRVANHAYQCADLCRSKGIYTVMGGHHVSALPEEAIQHCDSVVIGDGEKKLLELIESKEKGIFQGDPIMDLDSLPLPAYHLVNMGIYSTRRNIVEMASFSPRSFKVGHILTSRGCPYRCVMCYNSSRDRPIRYRSPEKVLEEIQFLTDTYGVKSICFLEDNLFANKQRLGKICSLLDSQGFNILWSGNTRVDNVTEDSLMMAYNAGCLQIAVGFESGSQRILDVLKKEITVEESEECARLANKVGIIVQGSVMVNNPTETLQDIKMTQSLLANNVIDGGIGVCVTIPLPGTELWRMYQSHEGPHSQNWDLFDYGHLPVKMASLDLDILVTLINETIGISQALFSARAYSRERKFKTFAKKRGIS